MMVVGSPEQAETSLLAGGVPCTHRSAPLRPHGHARTRTVRGLGQERADHTAATRPLCRLQTVPGAVAGGVGPTPCRHCGGYRDRVGGQGGRRWTPHYCHRAGPASLHGAALVASGTGEARPLAERAAGAAAFRLNPEMLFRPKYWPSLLGWSLNILAGAALAFNRLASTELPPWTVTRYFTQGNLLSPRLRT